MLGSAVSGPESSVHVSLSQLELGDVAEDEAAPDTEKKSSLRKLEERCQKQCTIQMPAE
jgi:hypothetical protein